ncbi:MAG: lysoplasmalogenase [Caldilineaceae bacterium]|nr:lysoplasmalogenase [Caldilineaceae bacterium]
MVAFLFTVLAVFSGAAYIWAAARGTARQRYILKPLTTFLILLVALTLPDPVSAIYRTLVAAGILLSIAGDVFLMLPGDFFVWGLGSFLVAHLFYIGAYQSRSGFHFHWAILIIFAAYAALVLALLWQHAGPMRYAVAGYALVLMLMGWQATEQYWVLRNTGALLAMAGAVFFLASDSALALDRFRISLRHRDLIVMSTYYAAQLLIAWSVYRF